MALEEFNQFFGQSGCGTMHFMVVTLKDNCCTVVLTSVDFIKDCNRLEHSICLDAFERKATSTDILKLVVSFNYGICK